MGEEFNSTSITRDVKDRILYDWVEFRTPGRFRITAVTEQIAASQSPEAALRLGSTNLDLEIVPAEPL